MSLTLRTTKATDDILQGSTVSSNAGPETSYSNATLLTKNPGARVRYGVGSVRINFALASPQRGDLLVIPTHNLDAGNTVLTLENDNYLSEPVTVPAPYNSGHPRTIIFDIKAAVANASTRTADDWTLVIASNTQEVILGGAVGIYSVYREAPDFAWGWRYRKRQGVTEIKNEYLARYRVNHRTVEREIEVVAGGLESVDLIAFENWFDSNQGSVDPSVLWFQRDEFDPFYGTWPAEFQASQMPGNFAYEVSFLFSELSKGKPLYSAAGIES